MRRIQSSIFRKPESRDIANKIIACIPKQRQEAFWQAIINGAPSIGAAAKQAGMTTVQIKVQDLPSSEEYSADANMLWYYRAKREAKRLMPLIDKEKRRVYATSLARGDVSRKAIAAAGLTSWQGLICCYAVMYTYRGINLKKLAEA